MDEGIEEKKTVLVVEDNTTMLRTLAEAFERENFTVLSALDGAWGLDMALREHPQVIVLDIMMANVDGITMLKQLRQHPWGKTVPVIILTNLTYLEDMPEVKSLTSEFLLKSDVTIDDIVGQVKKHLV